MKEKVKKLEKLSQVKSYSAVLGIGGISFTIMGIVDVLADYGFMGRTMNGIITAIAIVCALSSCFTLAKAKADMIDEATAEQIAEADHITLKHVKNLLLIICLAVTVITKFAGPVPLYDSYVMVILGVVWMIQFRNFIYVEKRDANGIIDEN